MRSFSNAGGIGSSETCDGGSGTVLQVMHEHLRRRARLKEELAGQRPVGDARQRIEVRPAVDDALSGHQLGRHEGGRALQEALGREHRGFLLRPILDDPEIQHLQVVAFEPEPRDEEVRGLDVAVHEPVLVRFGERPAGLAEEHDHPLRRLRSEARHDLAARSSPSSNSMT